MVIIWMRGERNADGYVVCRQNREPFGCVNHGPRLPWAWCGAQSHRTDAGRRPSSRLRIRGAHVPHRCGSQTVRASSVFLCDATGVGHDIDCHRTPSRTPSAPAAVAADLRPRCDLRQGLLSHQDRRDPPVSSPPGGSLICRSAATCATVRRPSTVQHPQRNSRVQATANRRQTGGGSAGASV